ncbi:BamA/TamA family outer membrane protein [Mucilaginibacter myungsuensis]|uniref:BamA/TamA family outer membrane protein n=1 Tax=Mucilaginibacter myungsuensis TaxID=649104 RepID=A0A929KWG9_9SPHI|nr:BamA/TamA family outer membrane protein [Mucilaginibacter myungsuensis]MBE9662906.1 BamA/TamA family outer membrane protein [Mucilaginibacter myungsuensis]MDN3598526.1 BamA/TamA family outer membrane protein [Mucilaginibacter myungsuensis]
MKIKVVILLALSITCQFAVAQNASSIIPDSVKRRDTINQTDLIDIAKTIIHIKGKRPEEDRDKRFTFSFLPVSTVPGGTGRALVTSTTAGIYLGPKKTTNLSSATFAPYWNFGSRFGLPLRNSVWLPNNTWTIQGDIRFLRYPQFTWGLGTAKGQDDGILVNYNYIRFHQAALKQIRPYFFAGVGYALDFRSNIGADDEAIDLEQFTGYRHGTSGSSLASGVTFNLLYDTRSSAVNPMPGSYANVVYRLNPTVLGSNNFWQSVYIDLRKYIPLDPSRPRRQNTLAFWSYLWTAFTDKAPYLDLPSIGWDPYNRSGRGIDQNRYRGQSLFYFETEYRRDITNNGLLGFVLFTNINTVSGSGNMFTSWHPAAGSGMRVKFNKASRTNLGVDYGFSKGYSAFQLNLGETF